MNQRREDGTAGLLAGLIGTGGAIRGLVLAAFDLEKGVFVATSAAIDSGVDLSRMIIYLRNNYLTADFYWYIPGLFLVAFAGSYTGKFVLNKIEQKKFPQNRPSVGFSDRRYDAGQIRSANYSLAFHDTRPWRPYERD